MTASMTSLPTFLTLPSELIESILISSRSPRTISSLAQTCSLLRTLVYASPDSHLWREMFLTTWDDPRPALEHRALIDPRVAEEKWDWGVEYRRRASADKWLTAWRRGVSVVDNGPLPTANPLSSALSKDPTLLPTLRAVLDTFLTLTPFPASPAIALTVLTPTISPFPTGNAGSGVREKRGRMTSAPPFPPLLLLLASGFKAVQSSRSGVRLGRIAYGPHATATSNYACTTDASHHGPGPIPIPIPIPTPSLPPQLTRTLFASLQIGVRGFEPHLPSLSGAEFWAEDQLGDVFHRIVCITGFAPIPRPLPAPDQSEDVEPERLEYLASYGSDSVDAPQSEFKTRMKPFPTPAEQYRDARTLARRRVYDMRYLRGDRMWGPYQVVGRDALGVDMDWGRGGASKSGSGSGSGSGGASSGSGSAGSRRTGHLGTLAWAMGIGMDVDSSSSSSSDDDDDDDDWHDAEEGDLWSSEGGTDEEEDELELEFESGERMHVDAESELNAEELALISFVLSPTTSTNATTSLNAATSTNTTDSLNADTSTNTTNSLNADTSTNTTNSLNADTSTNATTSLNATPPTPSINPRTRMRRSNPRRPSGTLSPLDIKPHHLRPDYTYLASVRIVVEANLRELFRGEQVGVDGGLEGVVGDEGLGDGGGGEGEAGMFWEDEDEILRAGAAGSGSGSVGAASSVGAVPVTAAPLLSDGSGFSLPTSTSISPSNNTFSTGPRTFELAEVLARFRNVEAVRVGGACGYWSGWVEGRQGGLGDGGGGGGGRWRSPRIVARRRELESAGGRGTTSGRGATSGGATSGGATSGGKGKGKGKGKEREEESAGPRPGTAQDSGSSSVLGDWEVGVEGEACEGWDWAGVVGIWRRCVCWMDYRELLFFNLDPSKFLTLDTSEACRIIPMELHITGYTRAGLMSISEPEETQVHDHGDMHTDSHGHGHGDTRPCTRTRYFRPPPIIHFTGSSIGSDRGLDDGRTVKGSVGLIGGGEVRWQMDTYTQDSSLPGSLTPEWSSEAVQIGGVGSAIGLLGMWTGAGHERADPLGPFWAWKVA